MIVEGGCRKRGCESSSWSLNLLFVILVYNIIIIGVK